MELFVLSAHSFLSSFAEAEGSPWVPDQSDLYTVSNKANQNKQKWFPWPGVVVHAFDTGTGVAEVGVSLKLKANLLI